jgi:MFS family permease
MYLRYCVERLQVITTVQVIALIKRTRHVRKVLFTMILNSPLVRAFVLFTLTNVSFQNIPLLSVGAQLATSLTIIGAWIGSLLGSYPAERYGRKLTLLGNNTFFIIGAVAAATGDVSALYVGRFITGIGVGIG